MMRKIINNFLPDNTFEEIKNNILYSENFSWGYNKSVAFPDDEDGDFYFNHILYEQEKPQSFWCHKILNPLLGALQFNNIIRARVNLYTRKTEQIPNEFHRDVHLRHTVALFSINTNNGYTLFKDGTKYQSVANSIIIFDGRYEHASVPQTDEKIRVNININLW
jgi:hypothetical protein